MDQVSGQELSGVLEQLLIKAGAVAVHRLDSCACSERPWDVRASGWDVPARMPFVSAQFLESSDTGQKWCRLSAGLESHRRQ
jgi:hypothetical protein